MLRDNANRVRDSHKAMMEAAGFKPETNEDDDEMGDIIITGDISNQSTGLPPAQPPALSTLAKAGIAASLLVGGGGIGLPAGMALNALLNPPAVQAPATPAVEAPAFDETDWELDIVDGGSNESAK